MKEIKRLDCITAAAIWRDYLEYCIASGVPFHSGKVRRVKCELQSRSRAIWRKPKGCFCRKPLISIYWNPSSAVVIGQMLRSKQMVFHKFLQWRQQIAAGAAMNKNFLCGYYRLYKNNSTLLFISIRCLWTYGFVVHHEIKGSSIQLFYIW